MDGPSLSHTHTSHLVLPLLLLPHFTIPYSRKQSHLKQRRPNSYQKSRDKKPPAQLPNTINILTYLSPPSQPYLNSYPLGGGGNSLPPFHSDNKIFLHPSPTNPPWTEHHHPSPNVKRHLSLFRYLHTRSFAYIREPYRERYPWLEVDLIGFATLCFCLRF